MHNLQLTLDNFKFKKTMFQSFITNETQIPTFIFIDGSYFCFHRYYSMLRWLKNAHPEKANDDPNENPVFVEKFKKTFVDNVREIPKNLGIHKEDLEPVMIVGKDCPRDKIWRNSLQDNYKGTRKTGPENGFKGGPFFKMAYQEELFQKGGVHAILNHSHLEADDCIAIYVKQLVEKYPATECSIYIITSDNDYLQLIRENVHIYNLAFKNLKESKVFTGNPEKDLKIKTIMGDVSDNIPSVFPKCGIKTAIKCVEDPEFFEKKMNNNYEYYEQYLLNDTLVSFDKIPQELIDEFSKNN